MNASDVAHVCSQRNRSRVEGDTHTGIHRMTSGSCRAVRGPKRYGEDDNGCEQTIRIVVIPSLKHQGRPRRLAVSGLIFLIASRADRRTASLSFNASTS